MQEILGIMIFECRHRLSMPGLSLFRLLLLPLLLLLHPPNASATLNATGYGPTQKGRSTFYGGTPDNMNPNTPSWGTLRGSCGCVGSPTLHSCLARYILTSLIWVLVCTNLYNPISRDIKPIGSDIIGCFIRLHEPSCTCMPRAAERFSLALRTAALTLHGNGCYALL